LVVQGNSPKKITGLRGTNKPEPKLECHAQPVKAPKQGELFRVNQNMSICLTQADGSPGDGAKFQSA